MVTGDLATLLARLVEAGVDLVVAGGGAAGPQGALVTTFDLAVVHYRNKERA